jgi:hypothetical protein
MHGDWWISDCGDNMLAGVAGDTDNPIRLPDDYVLTFLQKIPDARAAFDRMIGNMLPEEQTRLRALKAFADTSQVADNTILSDTFQSNWNKSGVFTCGPRGGGRAGGNG